MGGGGLAFLNKKTWHPGRLQNQEEKWKREQAAEKERRNLEELKKQIAEERQHEELEAVARAAGVKDNKDRLDWMYQGGMVARAEADKRNEEQMLGEKTLQLKEEAAPTAGEKAVKLPTFYAEDTPASANEVWQRIHSDPLFAIRQQEIAARKSIAANPVKMDAIKREVAQLKAAREAAKAERKAEKKAKKEAKRSKKDERKAEKKLSNNKESNGHADKDQKAPKHARTEPEDDRHPHHRSSHQDDRVRSHEGAEHSRKHGHDRVDDRHDSRHHDREDREYREGKHHRSKGGHDRGEELNGHHHGRKHEGVRVHIDAASAQQGPDLKYGLNFAGKAPEELKNNNRRVHAEASQRRLEEAMRKKEQEDKEKAAQRYVRKDYKTGRLTAEERERRLAEMAGNASVHEEVRWSRQKRARDADEAEEQANAAALSGGQDKHDSAAFLKTATQEIYGAKGEAATLEDRVNRRKYYAQR